jgi:hypothetical protein
VIHDEVVSLPKVPRMAVTPIRFRSRLAALALLIAGTVVAHENATGIVAERMRAMEDTAAQAKALDRALNPPSFDAADVGARAVRHGQAPMP